MNLELPKLIEAAAAEYKDLIDQDGLVERLLDFIMDRLKAYFLDQDIPVDVFAAVMERRPTRPYDFANRVSAVDNFRHLPEAASLAASNKRIQNILKQCEDTPPGQRQRILCSPRMRSGISRPSWLG